jgi:release factor glutamine methyltransferase
VAELLGSARARLTTGPDASGRQHAAVEAEVLLGHVLQTTRAWLFANAQSSVGGPAADAFEELVARRITGFPVAYLVGRRDFWSLSIEVTPDVLIPRPETELLVRVALESLPPNRYLRAADLGTGSGAVALAVAVERPLCEVHATEISRRALAVAGRNVQRLAPGRVTLHQGSWLEPLEGTFRVIVSNPPYVPAGDSHLRQGDCRFEPCKALSPGPDGLAAIREIAAGALPRLDPGGLLAFEHGFDQGPASRQLLEREGYAEVGTKRDLEDRDRVTFGYRR